MVTAAVNLRITPQEYLAQERQASTKSEYVNGFVYAMVGASRKHNLISGNVFGSLWQQLRGKSCEAYTNDIRVRVPATSLYTYPDVVVVCGKPRFEDKQVDTLVNPTVLIEVLSPSTEAYDRGDKFAHYRRLPSLHEYVLIAQERCRVEHFARQGEQWLLTEYSAADAMLDLPAIGCQLPLAEIYDRIEFEDGPDSR
jgi:Uma2 family endonuclease